MENLQLFAILFIILSIIFIFRLFLLVEKFLPEYYERIINISKHRLIYVPQYEEIIGWDKEKIINEIAYFYGWEKILDNIFKIFSLYVTIIGFIITIGKQMYDTAVSLVSKKGVVDSTVIGTKMPDFYSDIMGDYINIAIIIIVICCTCIIFNGAYTKKIKLLEAALKEKETGGKEFRSGSKGKRDRGKRIKKIN